jgi:hypothetical protein
MKVRGYIVSTGVGFLRKELGEDDAKRVIAGFSPKLRETISAIKTIDWCPVDYAVEINEAIVKNLGGGEERRARDALAAYGRFASSEATNTFLKLMMRVLTPKLFAKKLPDLWKRDFSKGELSVDVEDRRVVVHFSGVSEYAHLGAKSLGFIGFVFDQMGKTVESANVRGWSLDNPRSDTFSTEFYLKN